MTGLELDLPKLVRQDEPERGVLCLFYTNRTNPTVTIYGSIKAGMSSEPPEKAGLAEITSRLLIRGSQRLGAARIANMMESVGAVASFRNTQDSVTFHAKCTSPWLKRVLMVLSECLTSPAFRQKDFEREKEHLLTEIRLRDEDTTRRGIRELQELVYPKDHPYSRDRHGTPETVKSIQPVDVRRYFEEAIGSAPVTLSVAGDARSEDIVKWASKVFDGRGTDRLLPDGPDSAKIVQSSFPISSPSLGKLKEVVMSHKRQTDIIMGCPACPRNHTDYEPLNLLNVIVGELGFMGRLGQRVRDQEGLAYSCTSFLITGLLGGNWAALAGVNPKNVEKALALMREEVAKVNVQAVTSDELDAAKQNQLGSAVMELESTEGIARTVHNLTYYGLGLDYFSRRRELYADIDADDLLQVSRKYLDSSSLTTVIVGPRQGQALAVPSSNN